MKIQRCAPSLMHYQCYPKWRTILENDYSLEIAREDGYVTKETRKFLRLFDHAISMITGQPIHIQSIQAVYLLPQGPPSESQYDPKYPQNTLKILLSPLKSGFNYFATALNSHPNPFAASFHLI